MEPNKFEHSAKLLLDEFSIHPTENVWNTIQPQIQQQKSNNKFVAIVIVITVVFLLSNFNLYDLVNHMPAKNQHVVATKPSTSNVKSDSIDTTNNLFILQDKTNTYYTSLPKNSIITSNIANKISVHKLPENTKPLNATVAIQNKLKDYNINEPISINEIVVEDEINENSKSSIIDNAILNTAIEKNDTVKTATDIVESIQSNQQPTLLKDAEVAPNIATNKSKKWQWSISATAGISAVNSGLFKQSNSVFLSSIDFNNTTGSGTAASSDLFSTAIQPSFGFSLGAQVQYILSNKSALQFGLQYNYTSNRIKVSKISNASLNSSLESNALLVNGYTNQFHLIELPFAYVYSFKKNNHSLLQFQLGGSVAHLIHSNALQLTEGQGVFYKDNSILHKSFFSANASILFNLTKKTKSPFLIGPSYSLYLTPLSSKGLYNQVHTSLLGIKIQKYLSKK